MDNFSPAQWEAWACEFLDRTIYQTWAYQQIRAECDRQRLSRAVIRDSKDRIVMMGQVRIKRITPFPITIGYVQWGPLHVRREGGAVLEPEVWKVFREVYRPYADILRIVPMSLRDGREGPLLETLHAAGFNPVSSVLPYHTYYLSLEGGDQAIQERFHRSWRRGLKKAEQSGLDIRQGSDPSFFEALETIYASTRDRKNFQGLDPHVFVKTQNELPLQDKIQVIIAYHEGRPVTAHASSFLGRIGQGILAGSTEKGLELSASYQVWWRTLLAAHQAGMDMYDLGGIDFVRNPSVSQFKQRMGGVECQYVGAFDACNRGMAQFIWTGMNWIVTRFHR